MLGVAGVLAHQGGWDEMLLVAVPIAIFVILLRVANTRAGKAPVDNGADKPPEG